MTDGRSNGATGPWVIEPHAQGLKAQAVVLQK